MTSRKSLLSGMFAITPADPQAAPPPAPRARVASGAVKSMGLSLGSIEAENERLRHLLESGAQVVELDPGLCDDAPIRDRFAEQDPIDFTVLKASIHTRGQEVPVLVRPHGDRFQVAYGHRRVRACRELGRPVRAIIKPLSDLELIYAQGLENAARQDLSWIERACYARALDSHGYDRDVICEALALGKPEVSRMITTAAAIPDALLQAIGPAPRTGRPRWMELATLVSERLAVLTGLIGSADFARLGSDDRILFLLSEGKDKPASDAQTLTLSDRVTARVSHTAKVTKLAVDDPRFGAWLADRLPELYSSYEEARTQKKDP